MADYREALLKERRLRGEARLAVPTTLRGPGLPGPSTKVNHQARAVSSLVIYHLWTGKAGPMVWCTMDRQSRSCTPLYVWWFPSFARKPLKSVIFSWKMTDFRVKIRHFQPKSRLRRDFMTFMLISGQNKALRALYSDKITGSPC